MQGDLQLCQPVGRVLTFLMDLQVFPGHGVPAATVSCQLVNKLVLTGQRQAEPGLSPVGETQLPPLADRALDSFTSLSGLRAQGQQPLPQEAVEQLVAGGTVLAQYQDVRGSAHSVAQELFLMAGERDAAELAWGNGQNKRKGFSQ